MEELRVYLSVKTAARYTDLSPSMIRKLLRQGLPSIRIGRAVRIRIHDLDVWLTRQGAATTTDTASVDSVITEIRASRR